MAKRRCKGVYVRIVLPDELHALPSHALELINEASEFATLRAHSIWRMSEQLSEETFRDDHIRFAEIAGKNRGLLHLLLSVFYTKIHQEIEPRAPVHKIRIRNKYLVAAMAQRELAHACLSLPEEDARNIQNIDVKQIGIDAVTWYTNFVGARSVARVICAFIQKGAEIFFPIAYVDIQLRIDLLVRLASSGVGLCVQIKTVQHLDHIQYRLIREVPFNQVNELSSSDEHFLNGVTEFRNDNPGLWLPLEIKIGSIPYKQTTVHPPEVILNAFDQMIQDLVTTKDSTPKKTET